METAECKTLWIGDVQINWDEAFLGAVFASFMEQPTIKLIRDKVTGYPAGYGFIEFPTAAGAQAALDTYNGQLVPGTNIRFRLNWGAGGRRLDLNDDHSIFVGDLAPEVTDEVLLATFSARFSTVRGAKVVVDPVTRMSKGFGFVRFGVKEEADQALLTMNGVYCSSRPMRVSVATDRSGKKLQQIQPMMINNTMMDLSNAHLVQTQLDELSNTTVFVGGIDPTTTEDVIRNHFSALGSILSVKIPAGRNCGFVQFATREQAELAISQMNGSVLGGAKVRCAWGRSTVARPAQVTPTATTYYPQYGNYMQYQSTGMYQPQQMYYGGYAPYYHTQHPATGYTASPYTANMYGMNTQGNVMQQQQYMQPMDASYISSEEPQLVEQDFTTPDNVIDLNNHYVNQRAYQHMPPVATASYVPAASNLTKGTAMAGST